jgi:putative transposase
MKLMKSNHCVYKIRYHIVLTVKYRKKLLFADERISFFKSVLSEIAERYDFFFEAIGTDGDHVHLFVGAAPKYAASEVVGTIKSITARQLFAAFPAIKEVLWGEEFWTDGFYVGTVGDGVTSDIIKAYVENQGSPEEKTGYAQFKLTDF